MAVTDGIAAAYCRDDPRETPVAQRYLRENLAFRLTPAAIEGLRTFYREAAALGLIEASRALAFYEAADQSGQSAAG